MTKEIIKSNNDQFEAAVKLVLDGLNSKNSQVMYKKAILDFIPWSSRLMGQWVIIHLMRFGCCHVVSVVSGRGLAWSGY